MGSKYSSEQLNDIMEQGMVLQCACPSMLARLLSDARYLNDYQASCLRDSPTNEGVHEAIARATETVSSVLEQCLTEVLLLEEWEIDREGRFRMPQKLVHQQLKAVA